MPVQKILRITVIHPHEWVTQSVLAKVKFSEWHKIFFLRIKRTMRIIKASNSLI